MKRLMLVVCASLLAAPAWGQSAKDLALVPSDAVAFVHVRAADMWNHDIMKGLRDTVAAAGPKAIAAFDSQVYPSPADLDRVTLVLRLNEQDPNRPPHVTVIVSFKNDVDGAKLAKLYMPGGREGDLGSRKGFIDADRELAMHMPDPRHVVLGPVDGVQAFLAKGPGGGQGPLAAEMAVAASGSKSITIGVNVKAMPIPPNAFDELPPEIRPLARVERALLTLDLAAPEIALELRAAYASEAAAKEAEGAFRHAMSMAKQAMGEPRAEMEQKLYANAGKGPQPLDKAAEAGMALVALGALNRVEAMMDTLPVARSGSDMTVTVTLPREVSGFLGIYSASAAMLLPAVSKVQEAAGSSQSSNNLKMMGLAIHNHANTFDRMPSAAICDPTGKPLLSWRVAILPYIEQDNLYRQFKLDEPWDSEHNKALIEKMPKLYASPRVQTKPGETVYKAFVGKDAIFDWKQSKRFQEITDGTSNTAMIAEAGEPVIWTKPDDFVFDYSKPAPKLELPGGITIIHVCFGDGSVRRLDISRLSEQSIKNLIHTADGNYVDLDNEDRPPAGAVPVAPAGRATSPPPTAKAPPPPPRR